MRVDGEDRQIRRLLGVAHRFEQPGMIVEIHLVDHGIAGADAINLLAETDLARVGCGGGFARRSAFGGERAESVELRSEEHTSELQSLMRISYAVFCLKKKQDKNSRLQ